MNFQILNSQVLFWILLSLFIGLNVLDAHSTHLVMRPHHYHRERNPVARWVFRKLGLPGGIVFFKALLLGVLIPAMIWYKAEDVFSINIVLSTADILFVVVVAHNYNVYRKIQKNRRNR